MTEADIEAAAAVQVDTFGGVLADAIDRYQHGPRYTWRDGWVIGDGQDIRAAAIAIPARWWFRGRAYAISAIAAVAVRAVDRRRGLATELMRAIVRAEREAERPFSLLYPFQHGFYRRLGYATVGLMHYWRIPTAQLASNPSARAPVRSLREADRPAVAELHQRWLARGGGFERTAGQWDQRWAKGDERWVVYDDDRHGVQGYLAYRRVDRTIALRELVAERAEAERGLWGFLGAQVEQQPVVTYHAPLDQPLWARLREPLMFEATNRGFLVNDAAALTVSFMARAIDVRAALTQRAFPPGLSGRCSIELRDPVLAPTGEIFEVTLDSGQARVEDVGGDQQRPPDARCDIGTFSQLFCGALTASRACWYGLLEANDDALALLDQAFPPGPPYVHPADWF